MKQSVRLGRIGGITVGAHRSVAEILVNIAQVLAVSVLPAGHVHECPAVKWTVGFVAAALFLGSLLPTSGPCAGGAAQRGHGPVGQLWMLGG